jgi:hypothetical protein
MKISRHPSALRNRYERLESDIKPMRDALVLHWVYSQVGDLSTLRTFMRSHIFAVWDFMSLLKTLQHRLTCVDLPWMPPEDPVSARLINEINLAEESDEVRTGLYMSHFELYLRAMEELGADRAPIEQLLGELRSGTHLDQALSGLDVSKGTTDFVRHTMATTAMSTHEVAASFLFGREAIIPGMFREILDRDVVAQGGNAPAYKLARRIKRRTQAALLYRSRGDLSARPASAGSGLFLLYLDRHIELDNGSHGPMAAELLMHLCGNDEEKWQEATVSAAAALTARHKMWDGVAKELVRGINGASEDPKSVIDLASRQGRGRSS